MTQAINTQTARPPAQMRRAGPVAQRTDHCPHHPGSQHEGYERLC
jgi:hypothetical protein